MPRRNDDYHGSGWRFTWRIDRLQKLHELGNVFGLTEDSNYPEAVQVDEQPVEPRSNPGNDPE